MQRKVKKEMTNFDLGKSAEVMSRGFHHDKQMIIEISGII